MNTNIHKKRGFTIMEVMIAMAIIGIAFTALMISQGSVAKNVARVHSRLRRLSLLTNMYNNPDYFKNWKENTPYKAKIEYPPTDVFVDIVSAKSLGALSKLDDLYILHGQAKWEGIYDFDVTNDVAVLRFFIPPKKKEATKES
jgi:prepilin-type N-terminal cleavage/methylation domain-containing protein